MSLSPKIEGELDPIIRGDVRFGRNVRIAADWKRSKFVAFGGAVIDIGDNVFINNGCLIVARKEITILKGTLIGPDVKIIDSNQHTAGDLLKPDEPKPVLIGRDVWICANAVILPGTIICNAARVAAGAVVSGRVEPKSLAAGNPARKVKPI